MYEAQYTLLSQQMFNFTLCKVLAWDSTINTSTTCTENVPA